MTKDIHSGKTIGDFLYSIRIPLVLCFTFGSIWLLSELHSFKVGFFEIEAKKVEYLKSLAKSMAYRESPYVVQTDCPPQQVFVPASQTNYNFKDALNVADNRGKAIMALLGFREEEVITGTRPVPDPVHQLAPATFVGSEIDMRPTTGSLLSTGLIYPVSNSSNDQAYSEIDPFVSYRSTSGFAWSGTSISPLYGKGNNTDNSNPGLTSPFNLASHWNNTLAMYTLTDESATQDSRSQLCSSISSIRPESAIRLQEETSCSRVSVLDLTSLGSSFDVNGNLVLRNGVLSITSSSLQITNSGAATQTPQSIFDMLRSSAEESAITGPNVALSQEQLQRFTITRSTFTNMENFTIGPNGLFQYAPTPPNDIKVNAAPLSHEVSIQKL